MNTSPTDAREGKGWGPILVLMAVGLVMVAVVLWGMRLDQSLKRVETQGWKVGYAIEPPYAFLDEAGRVTGTFPELVRLVAAGVGWPEPEWVLAEFGSLLDELAAGRFDAVATGLYVTSELAKRVAFAQPAAWVGPGLLVAGGNPRGLHSYADAEGQVDVVLAALAGSVEAEWLGREERMGARMRLVPDAWAGLRLLRKGKVAGLALTEPAVRWLAVELGDAGEVEAATPFQGPPELVRAPMAVAWRPGDRRLRAAWNVAQARVLALGGPIEMDGLGGLSVGRPEGAKERGRQ